MHQQSEEYPNECLIEQSQQQTTKNSLKNVQEVKDNSLKESDHVFDQQTKQEEQQQPILNDVQKKVTEKCEGIEYQIKQQNQLEEKTISQNNQANELQQEQFQEKIFDRIEYVYLSTLFMEEQGLVYSFVFNKNETILFIGKNDNNIHIYEFNNGQIGNKIDTLYYIHRNDVSCLIFVNKSNTLISGSCDNTIIVWQQDQNEKWKPLQILKEHKKEVSCLIINEDEDLLISGSDDQTIRFWKQLDQNWSCQQVLDVSQRVRTLSLNLAQTKLISCGYESDSIKVIEIQSNQEWSVTQIIEIDEWGYRLGFLDDNQFIFQPTQSGFLVKYRFGGKQFQEVEQIQVQNCRGCVNYFPIQYIKEKNILCIKHGTFINIFKINQKKEIVLQQSFEFITPYVFGKLTADGQFLLTWYKDDYREFDEIVVRKLQCIK